MSLMRRFFLCSTFLIAFAMPRKKQIFIKKCDGREIPAILARIHVLLPLRATINEKIKSCDSNLKASNTTPRSIKCCFFLQLFAIILFLGDPKMFGVVNNDTKRKHKQKDFTNFSKNFRPSLSSFMFDFSAQ